MDFRQILGGVALMGCGFYSLHSGTITVGRHESFARVDSPSLFMTTVAVLVIAGICFIAVGVKAESDA